MSLPPSHLFKRLRGLTQTAFLALFLILFAAPFTPADAQCSGPGGDAGQIIFGEDHNVPAYCDGTDWIGMAGGDPRNGGGDYIPNSVIFDNTTNILSSTMSGIQNSDAFLLSFWVKPTTESADFQTILNANTGLQNRLIIALDNGANNTNDLWTVYAVGYNSSNAIVIEYESAELLATGVWSHVLISVDASASTLQVYINDTLDTNYILTNSGNGDIELNVSDYAAGEFVGGGDTLDASLAEIWFGSGVFLDLSTSSNRRKFVDNTNNPVFLGNDGSAPTGASPDIYLTGSTANWHINKGTAGGFTENGTLADEPEAPYTPRTKIVPSGLLGHWRLDETTGSIAYDSSGKNRHGTEASGMTISSNSSVGVINNAINFGGGGERIDIPDDPEWTLSNGKEMTIAGWINFSTVPQSPLDWDAMIIADAADLWGFEFNGVSGSSIRLNWWDDTTDYLSPAQNIFPDTWYHVGITLELGGTNTSNWWFNGEDIGSFSPASASIDPASISIGGVGGSTAFTGLLDDVRIYNRRLSAEEMSLLASAKDGIRYNSAMRTMEYFDGNQFISMTPEWATPSSPKASECATTVGEICNDGTVYAGLSTDGSVPMYTTRCNIGQSWDGSACTGSASNLTFTDGFSNYLQTTATSDDDGDGNTAILLVEDSNSGVAGIQPHDAAVSCDSLTDSGHSDWYLPSENELDVLFTNQNAIGNFASDQYWSSTDVSGAPHAAYRVTFPSGTSGLATKNGGFTVRCVRKGDFTTSGVGSLIGHWKLDETIGTIAYDSSGNGHDGTMQNGLDAELHSNVGAVGNALFFDGAQDQDDYIEIASNPAFSLETYSIAAWIKIPGTIPSGWKAIVTHNRGGPNWYFLGVNSSSDRFHFRWSNTETMNSNATFSADEWMHVVATYDYASNTARIYVNGVLDNTDTTGSVLPVATDSVTYIGRNTNNTETFPGYIDDVYIYARALSLSEVQQLYNKGTRTGTSTALPQGCPNVGDTCDDGTIYGGLSVDDGTTPFFVAGQDAPTALPWNNDNATGTTITGTTASTTSGQAETLTLVTTDSDSGTSDFQPHRAAQYCFDLSAHGADDWFLAGPDELDTPLTNYSDFNLYADTSYWTSRERTQDNAHRLIFNTGTGTVTTGQNPKSDHYQVRCLRKGPAPRCANPYGLEGQLIYNTNGNLVQYCDGARWLAIGKGN